MSDQQAWFEYETAKGKFGANPIHWKGWASLLALISVPPTTILFSIPWLRTTTISPALVAVAVLVIVFGGGFALIRLKGRPVAG